MFFFLSFSFVCFTFVACNDLAKKFRIDSLPGLNVDPGFEMYSGFITVDEASDRQLFFFHTKAQNNPDTAPWVLWLTGGPGCSSLLALLAENGPFRPQPDLSLSMDPYSWNVHANVVWLESPAGVGFSKSANKKDYDMVGDVRTAEDSYHFLLAFQDIFNYHGREFWITGESYGGHYVPELAWLIFSRGSKINLQGFMVGNAWTFSAIDNPGAVETWWQRALVPQSWANDALRSCNFTAIGPLLVTGGGNDDERMHQHHLTRQHPFVDSAAAECQAAIAKMGAVFRDVDIYDIYIDECKRLPAVEQRAVAHFFNKGLPPPSQWGVNPCISDFVEKYLNRADVQLAMHVGPSHVDWTGCSHVVHYNQSDVLLRSMIPVYRHLIANKLKILVYSGDVDAIVPYAGSRAWITGLGLKILKDWRSWHTVDGFGKQTGGFVEVYEGLTFATVRNAGHQVPFYQPERAFFMFNQFLKNQTLPL